MEQKVIDNLIKLRKENGYSQETLAEKLNVSRQAVSKWERGESSPDSDNLIALAKIYNISFDDLLLNNKKIVNKVDDEEDDETLYPRWVKIINGVTPLFCVIVYLLLGFLISNDNGWICGWTVFFLIPIVPSIFEAIYKKDITEFVFPVFIVAIYLNLGMIFSLWHPTWIIFILIPIFYIIFHKKNDKYDD